MKYVFTVLCIAACAWSAQAKTRVEITEENTPAIVAINVLKKDGSTFTGTGFTVSPDGVIATSRHVVDGALFTNITFNTGVHSGEAKILALADQVDLALIKIDARSLPTVTLADSDYVLPGEEITVIGNPRRLQNTVTSGLLSQVRKKANGTVWHQISAPISPSSSGSPVFNENGEVISIAFSSYEGEGNQNLNFAVPSNYLAQLLKDQGYLPPAREEETAGEGTFWDKIKAHFSKSWAITKRFFTADR